MVQLLWFTHLDSLLTTLGSTLRTLASHLTQTLAPTWVITTAAEHGPSIHGIRLISHTELPVLLGDNHGMLPHTSTPTLATNANLTQSSINHIMLPLTIMPQLA